MSNHQIVLSKACECGSQTGTLGSSPGNHRSLRCAECNKYLKFVPRNELEALVSSGVEPVFIPLRRKCQCGNQKGMGVQAGSQWIVRCLRCETFSHFATEAEVLRSGSSLTRPQAVVKKGTKAKTAKVTKLAIPLRHLVAPVQPKTEEAREQPKPKTAPVVALAAQAPMQPKAASPVLAPVLPKVAEVRESPKPKVIAAPAIEMPEPELSPLPPPERSLEWEEEFVAGVAQELRMMALKRKMVELRNTLTWPLCHWRSR